MIEVMVLLVSEQPMPNYLALLELKPRYIYMLRTEDAGLRLVAKNLVSSITQRFPGVSIRQKMVQPYDMISTYNCCQEICRQYSDHTVVINVTGGTKLMAFGALRAGLEHSAGLVYVDTARGTFLNLGSEEVNFPGGGLLPGLTIDDFISLAGARVIYDRTDFAISQESSLRPLSNYLVENSDSWQETCIFFQRLRKKHLNEDGYFKGPETVSDGKRKYQCRWEILHKLRQADIIFDPTLNRSGLSFQIQPLYIENDWVFMAGSPLELCAFYRLAELGGIDDVRMGVKYSWNAEDEERKTENELDILISSGARLTCISCKSGNTETAALNELDTYAARLGGTFANKVMVGADRMLGNDKFMARAGKMGIKTIHISEIMADQFNIDRFYEPW